MMRKLWEGLKSLRRGGGSSRWDFGERRELVRLRCQLDVQYTIGSRKYQGQILDMSLGGMMLRCPQPPAQGSMTDVTYETPMEGVSEQTVRCRVQWVRSRRSDHAHFLGLSYSSNEDVLRNSWVKAILRDLGFRPERVFQKRKYVRVNCFIPAEIRFNDNDAVEGRLYNLGANGTLLEAKSPVVEGEAVNLTIGPYDQLKPFEIRGRVVTTLDVNRLQFLGIQFEQPSSSDKALNAYLKLLLEEGGGI